MENTVYKQTNLEYLIELTLKARINKAQDEEFKACPAPYSRYKISKSGIVIGSRLKRPIKQYINSCGYVILGVTKDGSNRHTTVTISRLLALAWIPNPEHLSDVDHLDNNRLNNALSNLRWISHRDNLVKDHRRQLMRRANGRPIKRLNDDGSYVLYNSIKEAAEANGLSNTSVSGSCSGTLHLNKPFYFSFVK
ncbi:HNH endonuclease [Lacticaseibacillus paracasei]|uniref:HNH endonuclease n=1 Tax=Lacticaseibacillus paracasei TaxID=1597 RepID=UPI001378B7B2|nr:HNH endonuclease [Lacticaseibacillus paracasei]MCZ2766182.1 HNH endonuclease [Lacticaseibacillus paracasei]MCZ2769107.1 HNH endonuclease [Lacticaseibacillus paracasei]MCZ2774616.1 HNH endonuclease [Lacticaseibacillus paracasei]MCZ2777572.1 HNH endonuclease [Lacticaseibacillus paracasei]MCZ2783653.1 HNH endonuclease [Lacticaseibacillus paracasei]